jgi:hypothetical protein
MKKYRSSFLTKGRHYTRDKEKAEKSMFMYRKLRNNVYSLSLLGIINGFLSKVNLVMYAETDVDTQEILKYKIERKVV